MHMHAFKAKVQFKLLITEGGVRGVQRPQNRTEKHPPPKNGIDQNTATAVTDKDHNMKVNVSLDKTVNRMEYYSQLSPCGHLAITDTRY